MERIIDIEDFIRFHLTKESGMASSLRRYNSNEGYEICEVKHKRGELRVWMFNEKERMIFLCSKDSDSILKKEPYIKYDAKCLYVLRKRKWR